MSDEPNDAVATSPDPTEEVDAVGAAPVEAVPNPTDEVDQLKVPHIAAHLHCVSIAFSFWRGTC